MRQMRTAVQMTGCGLHAHAGLLRVTFIGELSLQSTSQPALPAAALQTLAAVAARSHHCLLTAR
jgi:hypothetical protein